MNSASDNNSLYLTGTVTASIAPPKESTISFYGTDSDQAILFLEPNGNIYVKGKLAETDKEVVEGMRAVIMGVDSYWKHKYDSQIKELEEYKFKYEQLCK